MTSLSDPATRVPRSGPGSDFARLTREVKEAGLLDRRRGYYAARILINVLLLAASGLLFVLVGESWWQLLTAVLLAVVFTQFAFIGHDAGHRQIFRSHRHNDIVGHLHGGVTGISYQWWVGKHTRHHANPNHEDHDPDIEIHAIAFSREQAGEKQGLYRWITKYQAFLFFPLLLAEAVVLRISGLQALWRGELKRPWREAALQLLPAAAYLAAVFLVLSPLKAVVFIAVHQGLMGVYLGCSFAPNHKGMPIIAKGQRLDHLRKQVLTSRNVTGGRWVDALLGGLNHQIEHHLFPHMPRPNLRRAQPIVEDFCARHGIPYSKASMRDSYAEVLRHLHDAGAPLRSGHHASLS
ncbi:fatty acid desaturase family protein [Saccharothrix yanglingensis]|uniref:Delta fatty acid desaturase n=1 Tax=Saccharothrix yanglingensis TaxID=659496 RepID=A0ABU0XAZ3_9PSEU|nr:acyl-CoA desaturase [Saccharothrix yanglingensis]MDQ2589197.1 delta fatty acid desaturase [Saccharothrix yanglingensis]